MDLYRKFFEEKLAFTGYAGPKTKEERFPGAINTVGFEAMMQDGKALQAATTHDMGQNFARSIGIKFQGRDGKESFAHTTSWAYSARTIGGLIMMHGDDDGMIMPPRVAPVQVIILPVIRDEGSEAAVMEFCQNLSDRLKKSGFAAKLDSRDLRTSDKMWEAVKKGIPVRVEVGQREMEANSVTFVRRDIGKDSKVTCSVDEFAAKLPSVLDDIHNSLLARNKKFRDDNTFDGNSVSDINDFYKAGKIGFVRVPVKVLEDPALEKAKDELKVSTRCMPFEDEGQKVLIAKSY